MEWETIHSAVHILRKFSVTLLVAFTVVTQNRRVFIPYVACGLDASSL